MADLREQAGRATVVEGTVGVHCDLVTTSYRFVVAVGSASARTPSTPHVLDFAFWSRQRPSKWHLVSPLVCIGCVKGMIESP
jgi:hypothetical protein